MSTAPNPSPSVFGGKTALILGAVFLALFAVLTLLSVKDQARRPQLEQIQAR